jgi:uncharacterized protein YjbI with pentapeptide repeats
LQGADLGNSDLRYRNFKDANLSNSYFVGGLTANGITLSRFGHNDVTNANLSNVHFDLASVSGQDFTTAAFVDTSNFHNKDLTTLHLDSVQFSNSNLSGVNLSGWVLGCAPNTAQTTIINSNVAGANLSNLDDTSVLTCTAAPDFSLSNFSGTNFTNAKLINIAFNNANLSNVNFTNVDLTGASLSGATITGVTWFNTTCPDGTNSNSNGNTCEGHL